MESFSENLKNEGSLDDKACVPVKFPRGEHAARWTHLDNVSDRRYRSRRFRTQTIMVLQVVVLGFEAKPKL